MAALIEKALRDGRLLGIHENGNLQWSNKVPKWRHGLPPSAVGPGPLISGPA
jgi:hypothetical protein